VRAAYSNESVGIDRVVRLVWRAAGLSAHAALGDDLAAKEIAQCARAVAGPADAALATISRLGSKSDHPTLAIEIARRAALGSLGGDNRVERFAENLFREATKYLVARDAPSLVSDTGRLRTVRDVVELKNSVAENVATIVRVTPTPPKLDATAWRSFVQSVVKELGK
jgi:hypothetical protein